MVKGHAALQDFITFTRPCVELGCGAPRGCAWKNSLELGKQDSVTCSLRLHKLKLVHVSSNSKLVSSTPNDTSAKLDCRG